MGVRPEQGPTLREMIIENLMLERQQVAAYTTFVRELGERDPTTWRIRSDMPASSRIISKAPPTCGREGVGAQGQEAP